MKSVEKSKRDKMSNFLFTKMPKQKILGQTSVYTSILKNMKRTPIKKDWVLIKYFNVLNNQSNKFEGAYLTYLCYLLPVVLLVYEFILLYDGFLSNSKFYSVFVTFWSKLISVSSKALSISYICNWGCFFWLLARYYF